MALAMVAGPTAAQITTLGFKNALVQFLLTQLSVPGEFEIEAAGVEEPSEGVTSLRDVTISDGEGVWLTLEAVSFSWRPEDLLEGAVTISSLEVDGFTMSRTPDPGDAPPPEPDAPSSSGEISWPRSPIPLTIEQFSLRRVSIAEGVAPQAIRFDGQGRIVDAGDAQTASLTIRRTDDIVGQIRVEYERRFDDDTLALMIEADEAPGGIAAAAAGFPETSATRLSATADGPPEDWNVTLLARVASLFDLEGRARIAYAGPVSATAELALTPGPEMPPALRETLAPRSEIVARLAEGADGLVAIEEAYVRAPDVEARLSGAYGRRDGRIDMALAASLAPGLARLVDGVSFGGARFDGRIEGVAEDLTATGDASFEALRTEAADVGAAALALEARIVGETITLSTRGEASGLRLDQLRPETIGDAQLVIDAAIEGETATLSTARLGSEALTIEAEGGADLEAETVSLAYRASAPELGPAAADYGLDLSGAASAAGEISGPFDAARLEGAVEMSQARLDGRPLGEATLAHEISLQPDGGVDGVLNLAASAAALGPAEASLTFALAQETLRVSSLSARAAGVDARGEGAVDLTTQLATATLSVDSADLTPLGDALGSALSGAATASISLSPVEGRQTASAEIQGRGVSAGPGPTADLDATLTAADLAALSGLDATVSAQARDAAGADLASLEATAAGSAERLTTRASARAVWRDQPATLDLTADVTQDADGAAIALNQLEASLQTEAERLDVSLAAPTMVRIADGVVESDVVDLSLPRDGAMRLRVRRDATGAVVGELGLSKLDLTLATLLDDAPIDAGALDAELTLDTRPGREVGRLTAAARGVRALGVDDEEGALALDLSGSWDGARARLDTVASGDFGDPITASLGLPLTIGPDLAIDAPTDGAIDGAVDWSGDIGPLWSLAPAPGHLLEGQVDIALEIGGVLADPRVSGDAALSDGRYVNLVLGTVLEELSLTSALDRDDRLTLDLSATDGDAGRLGGRIALDLVDPDPEKGGSIDATVEVREATLIRRDDVTARASADLRVAGGFQDVAATGRIEIEEAEIRLLAPPPADVVDLGDVAFVGEDVETDADPPPPPVRVRLDIDIDAPGQIFVRGRGVDMEWRGALEVGGMADAPRIVGRLETVRGSLDFLGRRFDLSRGRVTFQGGDPIDPALDIAFAREANEIEGRIEVTGVASDPEIGFASTPAVPEDEVLPRVLFGRSSQSLSAVEAVQLAAGVATLASGDDGVVGRARETLGLQVLQFDSDESGGSSVTAGRYVADGVFVGARQSLDGGSSAIVELEVLDGVTLDAEVGREAASSVGASWRYDF